MKSLTDVLEKLSIDSISEKLSIDSIVLTTNFPIDGTIDDMVEFLEDAGFKEISSCGVWSQTFEKYKKYNVKCYAVDSGRPGAIVEIINRANYKFKNKLFFIKFNLINKYNIFDDITTAKSGLDARQVSKEEFLAELSEIL